MLGKMELTAPCHFGMEAVLKKEIFDLGYDVTKVSDGRVYFEGDAEAICYSNVFLRTAERVLINVGEFKAETFEELFQGTKAIEWENYIPEDAKFNVVKAASVKSKLFSPTDIQKIMKKAMVDRLGSYYQRTHFEETGIEFGIRVMINKDIVSVGLDTTGTSLHKRGYRLLTAKAPIAENLAAAIILLSPWKEDRILVDPFCGSGTFPIEAALIGANIAPGLNRKFASMEWKHLIDTKMWSDCKQDARERIIVPEKMDIQGYDLNPEMVEIARENARKAGVDQYIHFQARDVKDLSHHKKYGFIITNPPYGERLMDKDSVADIYKTLGERYKELDSWSMYMITSYPDAETSIGRKADKNRKIYNGMMKTYLYQFMGPKPPKRSEGER
ncbi:MAG: class I SAM-dependent RNA methyltransferase [Lachnospiraceae bacterium]|nr:class I SAM-dependent RNA methyltransferase [Lachnospiraceae bacterium]